MRIFKEPFIHFLLIGAAVFVLSTFAPNKEENPNLQIIVDKKTVQSVIKKIKQQTKDISPEDTKKKTDEALEEIVRQEVLYREGLAMHLDRDDIKIKKRIVYKVNLVAVAKAKKPVITTAEIEKFYYQNKKRYTVPKGMSFRHILFSTEKRGDQAAADCNTVFEKIRTGELKTYADIQSMGDALTGPGVMRVARFSLVEKIFGTEFARNLNAINVTGWTGGITSRYGVHLVEITRITPEVVKPLDTVYPQIKTTLESLRDQKTFDAFYEQTKKKYSIVVEDKF